MENLFDTIIDLNNYYETALISFKKLFILKNNLLPCYIKQ